MAKLASRLILLGFILNCFLGCSMKHFESKDQVMESVSLFLIREVKVRDIVCPENDFKPNNRIAIKKCFAQSVDLESFVKIVNSELTSYATRIFGWQTDYTVTSGEFVTNDRQYTIGFDFSPKAGSEWEKYPPLANDTFFLSVIVEDNKFK
jgi:hypothetical protein